MIKCYYSDCKYHSKTEPFCPENKCKATQQELEEFEEKKALESLKRSKNDRV